MRAGKKKRRSPCRRRQTVLNIEEAAGGMGPEGKGEIESTQNFRSTKKKKRGKEITGGRDS